MLFLFFITYQLLQLVCAPLIALFLFVHHLRRNTFGQLPTRLGFIPKADHTHPTFWLHAVSVGEALSIQEFINLIKKTHPTARCYVTVGTTAGHHMAKTHLGADYVSFIPYDFLPSMLMAYNRIQPSALFIVDAEIWPNLIMLAHLKKVPLYLLNARIKQDSLTQRTPIKWLFRHLYNCADTIFAQSNQDQTRFEALGVEHAKIITLGNIKTFNVVAKKNNIQAKALPHQFNDMRVLLAGSIHPGEDNIYLELFKRLKPEFPTLKLIMAPRHFKWQTTLEQHVRTQNFSFCTWTDATQTQADTVQTMLSGHDIVLLCKLGELFTVYPAAELFFLGGTFVPVGGHNLLEPAVWGTPSIVGPHHQNCDDIIDKLTPLNGIVTVTNTEELYQQTRKLLLDDVLRNQMGANSKTWVEREAKRVERELKNVTNNLKL